MTRAWIAMLSVGSAVLIGSAIPMVPVPSGIWVVVILSAAVGALPFLVARLTHHFDVFEPVHLFAFSYLILFVLRPAFDLKTRGGLPIWFGYSLEPTYDRALLVGILGALAFYLGYYLPVGRNVADRIPVPATSLSDAALNAYIVFAVLFSLGVFALFVKSSGIPSLGLILAGRNELTGGALRASTGYLYTAPLWVAPLAILLLTTSSRWMSLRGAIAFGILGFSQILAIAYGDRSWMLPIFGIVLVVWYLRRGTRPSGRFVLIALVIVFFFGITVPRDYRSTEDRQGSLTQTTRRSLAHPDEALQQFLSGPDTAMVDNLAAVLLYIPTKIPYAYGSTYVEAAARPIPRPLWHSKPLAAESTLSVQVFPTISQYGGFGFSIFGEPYLNFGFIGVIGVLLIFGVWWKTLYAWFARSPTTPSVAAIYALNWPFLLVYVRGGIGADYQRQLIVLIPLLAAILFARVRPSFKSAHPTQAGANVTRPA